MAYTATVAVVFFFIYSIPFVFLPPVLSTRGILAIVGFVAYVAHCATQPKWTMTRKEAAFWAALVVLVGIALLSLLFNDARDLYFLVFAAKVAATFFAAYVVVLVAKRFAGVADVQGLVRLVVWAILVQSIIAAVMFVDHRVMNAFLSVQHIERLSFVEAISEFRIIGFGTRQFHAGAQAGFALILIGLLFRRMRPSGLDAPKLLAQFIVIALVGVFMARTAFVGLGIALLLIIFPGRTLSTSRSLKNFWSLALISVGAAGMGILLLYLVSPSVAGHVWAMLGWALELFTNVFETGDIETKSTDVLLSMYFLPSHLWTWIIGDGHWAALTGDGYYMHTDVGYLRMILYFGLPGLVSFFVLKAVVVTLDFGDKILKHLYAAVMFLYIFVLNAKGFESLEAISILFMVFSIEYGRVRARDSKCKGYGDSPVDSKVWDAC